MNKSYVFKKKNRYATFTFDDGFWQWAKEVDYILAPYRATFYIVTGWVKPNTVSITDKYNVGIDHGSVENWIELARKGHDIGSHSVTHTSSEAPGVNLDSLKKEYDESLSFIKRIHKGPYSLAFPYI